MTAYSVSVFNDGGVGRDKMYDVSDSPTGVFSKIFETLNIWQNITINDGGSSYLEVLVQNTVQKALADGFAKNVQKIQQEIAEKTNAQQATQEEINKKAERYSELSSKEENDLSLEEKEEKISLEDRLKKLGDRIELEKQELKEKETQEQEERRKSDEMEKEITEDKESYEEARKRYEKDFACKTEKKNIEHIVLLSYKVEYDNPLLNDTELLNKLLRTCGKKAFNKILSVSNQMDYQNFKILCDASHDFDLLLMFVEALDGNATSELY